MADLSKKEIALEWQEQSSGLINKGRVTLAAAVLAVGLSTSVQANDLLKQCDFNKNWAIDTPQMYGLKTRPEYAAADPKIKDIITREKKCETDFSIAQKDASIAQKDASITKGKEELAKGKEELAKGKEEWKKLDEDYNKMVQILVMLEPEEARKAINDEIKRIETQLKTEKKDTTRKSLLYRLDILKARLKELDKKVA